MMTRAFLLITLSSFAGCINFDTGGVLGGNAGGDGGAQARCEKDVWEQMPAYFDPCVIPEPEAELVLGSTANPGYVYDTTTGILEDPQGNESMPKSAVLTQTGGPSIRVLSVEKFDISGIAKLRVVGEHPLVVASWSTITVNGTINVGSSRLDVSDGTHIGAGANPTMACRTGSGAEGMDDTDSGGGGGGGGFGGFGGQGGVGATGGGGSGGGNGGTGGAKLDNAPGFLRGGCNGGRGGKGGDATKMDGSGSGGNGGGAIQLAARESMTISGKIHAGGAGGNGATADLNTVDNSSERAGGGGGGSGGMISLEAPMIVINSDAAVAANGGGGGEGVDREVGNPGYDGGTGIAAAGGGRNGDLYGGIGGDGGARNVSDGSPGMSGTRGGGGGGGGVGFIVIRGTTQTIDSDTLSPAPVLQ